MEILQVSGVAPVVRDLDQSLSLYREALGLPFSEGDYPSTDDVAGVSHLGLWTLDGAARSCFGSDAWPADVPVPQLCLEFEVAEVDTAARELEERGYALLAGPKKEPWGQTVARFLSADGLLLGLTWSPWLHEES
jgi:catechol 2,3-dioxygenase-like lactoylglutathione lyase family enzyme